MTIAIILAIFRHEMAVLITSIGIPYPTWAQQVAPPPTIKAISKGTTDLAKTSVLSLREGTPGSKGESHQVDGIPIITAFLSFSELVNPYQSLRIVPSM